MFYYFVRNMNITEKLHYAWYTHHHDKKRREAAEEVIACIDKYGYKLYSLNYGAETAALKNLAHDLQTDPVCMDAIQELQLKDVVNEMKNANVQFEKLFIERLSALSQEVIKSTKERIKSTTEAYRTLVQHVDAHATLAPSEVYDAFTSHLNENIEHFNQVVERRKNGQEAEVDEAVSGGQEEVTAE